MSDLNKLKDFKFFAENFFKIRTKPGEIKPFIFNRAQLYVHERLEQQLRETGKIRAYILKGRQQGISTYVQARYFHSTITHRGIKTFILTHQSQATKSLFEITKRYLEYLPEGLCPKPDQKSAKELSFGSIDSGYSIGTAGAAGVGRSMTIQLLHGCLSGDSLIVLADGSSKAMSDIGIGDLVMTSSGQIAPVKDKIFTGNKLTYTLKCWNSGEPIHLTEDHKVMTLEGYKELRNMSDSDYIAMPKMKDGSLSSYFFELKNSDRPQGGGTKHIESHCFELDYNFGYFIGYYLAEGYIKSNHSYITFTYHKDEPYILHALKGTQGLETSIRHKVDSGTNRKRTHVTGKFLASAINSICGRVYDKHIPSWMFDCNSNFLDGILRGYFDGDGSKNRKDSILIPSIHQKISLQIQRICWKLYGASSVKRFSRKRYDKKTKDIFLLRLCGNSLRRYRNETLKTKEEKSVFLNGQVYCKVKSISSRMVEPVWDIEIDHPDHNYQTTTGIVSNSEVALWENAAEHAQGLMQAVGGQSGTEIILESTAKGIGNFYHQGWTSATQGKSEYQAIFVPWYWQPEYIYSFKQKDEEIYLSDEEEHLLEIYGPDGMTRENIYWRRLKLTEFSSDHEHAVKRFNEEFPCCANDAFLNPIDNTFINSKYVAQARKAKIETNYNTPLIIGVDPAIGDNDRCVIIKRKSRVAYDLEILRNHNTMELAGKLKRMIDELKPAKVFIDCIGIGAGTVDRLKEMGYSCVVGINVARTANDKEQFANLRAELWSEMKDWLMGEIPVQIPDSDELQTDLCGLGFKHRSNGQLLIESKDDLKKRGMPSPDAGDSLMLTFAYGQYAEINSYTPNIIPVQHRRMFI